MLLAYYSLNYERMLKKKRGEFGGSLVAVQKNGWEMEGKMQSGRPFFWGIQGSQTPQ
jgi:hypothetical protein